MSAVDCCYNDFVTKLIHYVHRGICTDVLLIVLLPGPLSKTLVDFWQMIWQEKVYTVAMVTNLKENKKIKCQQYWPESGSKSYGPFMVTITDQQVFADYTIRLLQLQVSTHNH